MSPVPLIVNTPVFSFKEYVTFSPQVPLRVVSSAALDLILNEFTGDKPISIITAIATDKNLLAIFFIYTPLI